MKERPIIFSTDMVRAILDDRKTQTRRVIKGRFAERITNLAAKANDRKGFLKRVAELKGNCPYGKVGDLFWVKETWGSIDADHPRCKDGQKPKQGDRLVYRANPADDYQWGAGKPSQGSFCRLSARFMPKWAARLWLEITNIRVERVQEISLANLRKEGLPGHAYGIDYTPSLAKYVETEDFKTLWDSLNAKRGFGWDTNPYVWVIEFKRVKHNVLSTT